MFFGFVNQTKIVILVCFETIWINLFVLYRKLGSFSFYVCDIVFRLSNGFDTNLIFFNEDLGRSHGLLVQKNDIELNFNIKLSVKEIPYTSCTNPALET